MKPKKQQKKLKEAKVFPKNRNIQKIEDEYIRSGYYVNRKFTGD